MKKSPAIAVITWLVASKKKNCICELLRVSRVGFQTYLGDDKGLHQHDHAAGDHGSESNDVQTAQNIEDDVARTSQVFG